MLFFSVLLACSTPAPVAEVPAPEPQAVVAPSEAPAAGWSSFGAPITDSQALAAKELLATPQTYVGQTVLVEGRVADVCSKMGCWMVLTDTEGGEHSMRVTMKDHAFGLPKDCTGQRVQLMGEVIAKAVDPETVKHYQSESRKPEITPEAAATDGTSYELVASGVRLQAM